MPGHLPLPAPKSPNPTSTSSPPRSATGTLGLLTLRARLAIFDWCAAHGLELTTVRPFHVSAWIEDFPGSKPTVKQKLAAVRMLYDFLVVRQITPTNPAHSVRGPKYVVKKGKTPVWSREDAKTLLDSIPKDSVSGSTRTNSAPHRRDVLQLRACQRRTETQSPQSSTT